MPERAATPEKTLDSPTVGWGPLVLYFAVLVGVPGLGIPVLVQDLLPGWTAPLVVLAGLLYLLWVILVPNGFFIVQPNQSRVLVLFGKYKGTVRQDGFFFTNPFMSKTKISLRAHNLDGDKLKVNDLNGNPIEISAVVVWRVEDTARAVFDVEDYEDYVRVQSDAAVRQLATSHPYDDSGTEQDSITLRGSTEQVADELQHSLSERLASAGVEVIEARLNHLAYAPEIASAMLQRQQAKAVVDARTHIVEGAVGMVELALAQLGERAILELDDERRATLVGNLLVVLCGGAAPQPVLNTGSLYT